MCIFKKKEIKSNRTINESHKNEIDTISGKTSDIIRQLVYSGIAIIWLFKINNGNSLSLPKELLWPIILLVTVIIIELLHYLMSIIILRVYKYKPSIPYLAYKLPWAMWYIKVILTIVAYVLIGLYSYNSIDFID